MKKNILVVDDVDDVRKGLSDILAVEGYHVFEASNGKAALEVLDNENVDLLVTDILMPEMDGFELIREAQRRCENLKSIVISGGGRQLSSGQQYDYLDKTQKLLSVDAVLKKPFPPEAFIEKVKELVD